MSLDSIVFVSADLRTPARMPVVALMNYLAANGYRVTVITNNKSAFDDYRYDYRIVRRSFMEPFKGLNTRQQILEKIASEMPASIFVLTNSLNRTVVADARTIRTSASCREIGHKVVVWELMPFYSLLLKLNYADFSALQACSDLFDAFVTCYAQSDRLFRYFGQPNRTFIPFFFPFRSSEYSTIQGNGTQILFVQTAAVNYMIPQILDAFARVRRKIPNLTLKFVQGMNTSPVNTDAQTLAQQYAQTLGISDSLLFAQGVESFKSLLRESAFAVVSSGDVAHTSPTMLMQTVCFPFILACNYIGTDDYAALSSMDAADCRTLSDAMLRLLIPEEREKTARKMAAVVDTDTYARSLESWETLLKAVGNGSAIPEFGSPSGETIEPERLLGKATLYHLQRTYPLALFPQYTAMRETPISRLRKAARYAELSRTQKYTYIQMSPQDVRRSQLLALSLLREFERICIKHNLTYYVAAGSLLGAVRHHGQIPWDDDVDVTMPRKDYDQFIRIAQTELPDTMILPKNNFPYGFHRMQLKGTNIERTLRQKGHHGVFLDILPLDGAAPTEKLKQRHELINTRLMFYMFEHARPIPALNQFRNSKKLFIKRIIIKLFGSKRLLHFLWERNAKKYDVDTAKEWVCLPGSYGYAKECFPKEYWGEPDYLTYEGKQCPVMREWDAYLTLHYGDYMQCPAELEKRTHLLFSIDFGPYTDVPLEELEASVRQTSEQLAEMADAKGQA